MSSLETAAAKLEIQELESRYAWAIDEGRLSALTHLFAEDASLWSNRLGRTLEGRDAILGWYREYLEEWGWRNQRHYLSNFHIRVRDSHATARFYYLLTYEAESTSRMGWGHYGDNLARSDGRWWITEKRITTVGVIELEKGWAGMPELERSAVEFWGGKDSEPADDAEHHPEGQ